MITLYTFGSYFGLPDASPFVTKAMLLLKLAGLQYSESPGGPYRAPKGKLPFLDDGGQIVTDSTFIRFHIEKKYRFDFDAGLTAGEKAAAWAIEKMCEEHLYFAVVAMRWLDNANFTKGPAEFFKAVPTPVRPIVQTIVRRKVLKTLNSQGFGRHTRAEQTELAINKRHRSACRARRGETLFDGQPAVRSRRDGLQLCNACALSCVPLADPGRSGRAEEPCRLPGPTTGALFSGISRRQFSPNKSSAGA